VPFIVSRTDMFAAVLHDDIVQLYIAIQLKLNFLLEGTLLYLYHRLVLFNIAAKGWINIQNTHTVHILVLY